jgi:hypothetical protein
MCIATNKARVRLLRKPQMASVFFSCLSAGCQYVSGGPVTGHLDTSFLYFHYLQANAEMIPKFQVAAAYFS